MLGIATYINAMRMAVPAVGGALAATVIAVCCFPELAFGLAAIAAFASVAIWLAYPGQGGQQAPKAQIEPHL